MLADLAAAFALSATSRCAISMSRARGTPHGRSGQSTPNATQISSRSACQTALGKRDRVQVFGTDYPTPDGSCPARLHPGRGPCPRTSAGAAANLRQGGGKPRLNCGYGRGYSVLEVIDMVKRGLGHRFPPVEMTRQGPSRATPPRWWRKPIASKHVSAGSRRTMISKNHRAPGARMGERERSHLIRGAYSSRRATQRLVKFRLSANTATTASAP